MKRPSKYMAGAACWTAVCWGLLVSLGMFGPEGSSYAASILHPVFGALFFASSLVIAHIGRPLIAEPASWRDVTYGLLLTLANVFLFAVLCLLPTMGLGTFVVLGAAASMWYVLVPLGIASQFVMKAVCRCEEKAHA